jgi:hypothetical protein
MFDTNTLSLCGYFETWCSPHISNIHVPFPHDDHYRLHGIYARKLEPSVVMQNFGMILLQ